MSAVSYFAIGMMTVGFVPATCAAQVVAPDRVEARMPFQLAVPRAHATATHLFELPAPLLIDLKNNSITAAPDAIRDGAMMAVERPGTPQPRPARSASHRLAWGVIGAIGGFFAGGFVGTEIDRAIHPRSEDPGVNGLIFGSVTGAVIGAIVLARIGP